MSGRSREFIRKNKAAKVVEGAWLDSNRRLANGPPETWTHMRFRFDDGTQLTLTEIDLKDLRYDGHEVRWA